MKTPTIITAISLSGAIIVSAQSPEENPFFATLAEGYFIDAEAHYTTLDIGWNISDYTAISLQMFYANKDNDDYAPISLEEQYTGIGFNIKNYKQIGDNGGVYFSTGAGIAFIDAEARLGNDKLQDDTQEIYITAAVGVQESFTENLTGHIALRALWFNDYTITAPGFGSLQGPEHDINFGIEIGLTYKF